MKYIIDAPSNLYNIGGTLRVPVKVGEGDLCWYNTYLKAESYTESDRKAIEDEVWEFARGLLNYTDDDWEVITNMLLLDIPYQEAKAKYEAWLKRKDEIRVGDEVTKGDALGNGFVTRIDEYKDANIIWEMGGTGCVNAALLKKTGRHFPEVATLLQKMRGEKQ